jgi:small subunit ribosomal protein S1
MNLEMRVLEVDPIHRRIVLAVTNIPAEQPPRPETPSKIIPMDEEEGLGLGIPLDLDVEVDAEVED